MYNVKNLGKGIFVIEDSRDEWFFALTTEELSNLKDLITAALQDNDITESQYLKTKGEVA